MNVVQVKHLGAAIESELHIVECPLSTDQLVVELDDAYEITAKVVDSAMLDCGCGDFGMK